jgi:hypothetical protein
MVFKIASSQCSQVTIETISDIVAYNMESVIEANGIGNTPTNHHLYLELVPVLL